MTSDRSETELLEPEESISNTEVLMMTVTGLGMGSALMLMSNHLYQSKNLKEVYTGTFVEPLFDLVMGLAFLFGALFFLLSILGLLILLLILIVEGIRRIQHAAF